MMIQIDDSQIDANSVVGVFKFHSPIGKKLREVFPDSTFNLAGSDKKDSVILTSSPTGYIVFISRTSMNRVCAKINKVKESHSRE